MLKQWLRNITLWGTDATNDEHIRRRVIIANQLGFLAGGICVLAIILANLNTTVTTQWPTYFIVVHLFSLPFLNKLGLVNLSRYSMGMITPFMFLAATILLKKSEANNAFITLYFTPRYPLISTLLFTVLLIDIREKWVFWTALLFNFLCLAFFDPVHRWAGVGIDHAVLSVQNYAMASIMSIAVFTFIAMGYFFLQYINKQQEDALQRMAEGLRMSNEELQATEEEIKQNMEELSAINENLQQKNVLIEEQQKELQQQHQSVIQSLNYARRIQKGLLPSLNTLQEHFPKSFALEMPRDIVSGDFFWVAKVKDHLVVALCDCTGHGTAAALMTMVGSNLLHEVVVELHNCSPADILAHINDRIDLALKAQNIHDGMDMFVAVFPPDKKSVTVAGAGMSAYLIDDNGLRVLKNTSSSVGFSTHSHIKCFSEEVYTWKGRAALYMSSDGFQDQYNHADDEKFYRRRVKTLLEEAFRLPSMEAQEILLEKRFLDWKGGNRQTDDVLVLGVELG